LWSSVSTTGWTVRTTKGSVTYRPARTSPPLVPASRAAPRPAQPRPARSEEPRERLPDVPRRAEEGHEGDAGHDPGDREGQVHERVEDPAPRKPVAPEHPRDEQPEGRVERRRGERDPEGELDRGRRGGAVIARQVSTGGVRTSCSLGGRRRHRAGEREVREDRELEARRPPSSVGRWGRRGCRAGGAFARRRRPSCRPPGPPSRPGSPSGRWTAGPRSRWARPSPWTRRPPRSRR
jgi:hypothetical protein